MRTSTTGWTLPHPNRRTAAAGTSSRYWRSWPGRSCSWLRPAPQKLPAPAPGLGESGVPLAVPATATFTPTTGLLDGDFVTVVGTGFDPDTNVGICETVTPLPVGEYCSWGRGWFVVADSTGGFTIDVQVDRLIYLPQGPVDCAVVGACALDVVVLATNFVVASTLLQFDPSAPLPPAPTLTITPATNLEDLQLVTAQGTNFPRDYTVYLVQCRTDAQGPQGCTFGEATVPTDNEGSFTRSFGCLQIHRDWRRHSDRLRRPGRLHDSG